MISGIEDCNSRFNSDFSLFLEILEELVAANALTETKRFLSFVSFTSF